MSRGFTPNKDFKAIADMNLNVLEEYFQTRWFYTNALVRVRKAAPQHKCDLLIENVPTKELIKCKYTTICKPMVHHGIGLLGYENVENVVFCLHLPRKAEDYKKTWANIDYVIAKENRPEEKRSIIYYIDAKKLVSIIEQLISDQSISFNDKSIIYHRANLVAGIPMEDLVSVFGIVDMIDEIDWAKKEIRIIHSTLPVSEHIDISRPIKFRSIWDKNFKTYWKNFVLKRSGDRSKAVILTSIDTGKEFEFSSVAQASIELTKYLNHKVSESSIRDVIKGRSKTIITPKGRLSAKFKE